MTTSNKFKKDPDAVLDYGTNWADPTAVGGAWLATGETITASQWVVDTGLTKDSDSHDDTTATVWLSGGTVGTTYTVTNRITTTAGRVDDRSLHIQVVQR